MIWCSLEDNLVDSVSQVDHYAFPSEIAILAVYVVSDLGNLIVGDIIYIPRGGGLLSFHG